MFKKLGFLLLTLSLCFMSLSPVSAARINDFVDMWVEQVVNPDHTDKEKEEELKGLESDIDAYTFENYYFYGDESSYSGRTAVESSAMGKFETDLEEQELIKYTVKLLAVQAVRMLDEYPDAQLIRVTIMDEDNYMIAHADATFYNVDGHLVISQDTLSYNPNIDPEQMKKGSLSDKDNKKIPDELLIEE